jgi:hypothetical protein
LAFAVIAFFKTMEFGSQAHKDKRDAATLYIRILSGAKSHSEGPFVVKPVDAREQYLFEILVDQNRLKRGRLGLEYTIVGA